MKKIQVLLATYNGESFLKEQIDSVLSNFDKFASFDCCLLISDDASTDETVSIICDCQLKDERVIFLDGNRKGGVKENFNYLIQSADADYIFFCDQDDVWLDNKIDLFIKKFESYGDRPLLIHSDLHVVDQQLKTMSQSMFDTQKIFKNPTLGQLLVSNSVTGCVMAINKALLSKVKNKNFSVVVMHDWYIALVAKCFGEIIFLDSSTILYRQHGGNQVGSIERSFRDYFSFTKIVRFVKKSKKSIEDSKEQAMHFIGEFGTELNNEDRKFIVQYVGSFSRWGGISRAKLFFTAKVAKKGGVRNLIFFFLYVF